MTIKSFENFAKVSSQQNQQLYSEASKIPAGSGPARDSTEDMSSLKEGDKDAWKFKMQKRPELNNGGSLEDCISNVYTLLELPGIKWKCFRTKSNAPRGVPLTSDLVLKAYSKCVLDGILCTWRRKPLPPTDNHELLPIPHFSNDTPKELWVFWYDDEPAVLPKHCEGLESDEELSSANQMNIVSYEVRTILFKALHVVLERDLTKDGFVRFGRWFTVPYAARENYLHYMYPTHSPAIRFNFFLHGSSTICASIQAQRQPTLISLSKRHLECKSTKRFPLVVGPWSMRGFLVQDQMTLLTDPKMQETAEKEWNQWKEYLQLEEKEPVVVEKEPVAEETQLTRNLIENESSDEDKQKSQDGSDEIASDDIPQNCRWMYEPEYRQEKPKEETPEEKEERERAREVRRKRRKNREERVKQLEKQRADVENPEEYDSDVVTDEELEEKDESVSNEVPKMVLIEIDEIRMLYPSKFLCITLEEDRQMLESMGLKTNPVPQELQAQGRRPRIKQVVNAMYPILSTMAVYQYCKNEQRKKRASVAGNKTNDGQLLPPKNSWKFKNRMLGCGKCWVCSDASIDYRPVQFVNPKKEVVKTIYPKDRRCDVMERMITHVRKKKNFHAYHKQRPSNPANDRRIKKRKRIGRTIKPRWQRTIAQMRAIRKRSIDLRIKHRKQYEEDRLPPSGTCRVDSEDEAYQMDKNAQNDWANFNDEHPKGIPAIEVPADFEQLNEVGIKETKNGEDYKPEQFLPITFFTNTIDNNDFDALSGDDEMNEERFNQVFKDKFNKWKPDMSRGEKIENGNYMFDPLNRMTGSPRSYHLKEQRKSKYESILPTPIGNKFFTGDMCRKGLRGFEQLCAERDEIDRIRKAKWLKKQRRKVSKHEIKVARTCHLEMQKQIVKRSLKRTIKKLQITAKKDSVSDGTKQDKLLEASLKTKKDDNKFEKSLKEVEDVLDKLDVNSFCEKLEEAGPYGVPMSFGYIDPDYDFSPHSFVEEEPELEIDEQRTGLGEGTSVQYQDGESVDMSEPEREQINDSSLEISSIGHIRTVGEHIGPDGLLSPPASNEMPKGGPLSVGPPSIESQGLNQIYPTPPSVQMLQGDAAQPHSPVMHGKTRFMMNLAEEDIERVAVPGGGGSIVEIDADDFETKNMQKWNKLSNQSKLSKFLASSCNNPILKGRKKKYDTPVTEKFKIESEAEKISAKLVYKPMVSRKFDCPPHRSFAALVRPTVPDKRLPSSFAIPSTSSLVHPGMTTPMAPLFQSPTIPPHSTPSPFSAGPMGHHPMGPPAYPVTPGPFPPTTPTYPGMTPRPGSNFGPGPGYPNPHQMGGPGYPGHMGHMGPMGPQRQFSNPQMYQQQMQYQMRMQMQMRQMSGQGVPPGYGSAGVPPYQQGPTTPGTPGFGMSMQRLNNFVNQSQFTPNSGHSMPYGSMQPMIPQSPNFNQPYNQMGNPMMSPMQQHQFHQQQQLMQQQQQFQMQRNQMQLQNPQPQQQPFQPTAQMLKTQQSEQVYMAFQQLSEREKRKFQRRQVQLLNGLMPTSLQPAAIRNLKNPPDANIPYKKQDTLYRPPEPNVVHGDSLTIAIVFSDTLLDLHFDSVFDACPICSCSVSIRSRDLGMYIAPHIVLRSKEPEHTNMREHTQGTWSGFHVNAPTNCTCGFSAIRHRYLSCCSGLFEEDSDEATTSSFSVAPVIPPLDYPKKSTARDMKWFDSKSVHDMALLDQIRQMSFSNSLGKAISHMATVREHNRNIASAVELGTDITVPSEYILSHVDTHELLMLGNSVLGPMKKSGSGNPIASFQQLFAFFHPWGFQVANEIAELESSEWIDLLGIVTPTLEVSMKQARNLSAENSFTIEGPLTWKQIVTKAVRGKPASDDDEDFSLAEPVPAVMRALTKEAIRAAPNIEQYYDQASLGPVDQPKDVMYITVIPDDNEVYAKTVKFMDKVTSTYERMRLGRHIPFPVSTGTATRFREVYKSCQSQFPFPEQQQQLVSYTNQSLRNVPQKLADTPDPLNTDPETWSKRTKRKFEMQQENRENFDLEDCEKLYEESKKNYRTFPRLQDKEYENCPNGFYEREGILRVGTPQEPTRIQHNVTNTAEFEKMTKHLSDENGFVTRLRLYLQQMEDLVYSALNENPEAFERRGYRYQMAVEGRLKRQKHKRDIEEERLRFEAAKLEDEQSSLQKPDENDLSGIELGNNPIEPWVNDELEEKKRKRQKEDEQYLPEGHQAHQQAPSPVPAGMIHIPETLSEQERAVQPGLNEIFADPTTVAPLNAQNISWTQRDTRVPNPFPSSNQPPIAFEAAGSRDTDAYSTLPHVIVIYMINPFSYGTEGRSALHMRIAVLAFIRAFNSIMCRLPYQKRPQLQLEIVGLESIDDVAKAVPDYFNDPKVPFDILHELPVRFEKSSEVAQTEIARSLSVAVYTHPRVFFPDVYKSVSARCMTAFGPGSQLIDVIQQIEQINNDAFFRMAKRSKTAMNIDGFNNSGIMPPQQCEKKNYIAYRVPSNIVCLAPPPPVYQLEENGKPIMNQLDEQTLFISYCLVGTEFLVATATDAQGKLIDNCIANIKPRRESNEVYRYKNKTQILDGMGKLWSFILGVMSSEIKNWRLVVGRLGRIGHGEFRAWTHLLNKTSLLRYSGSLKDICTACRSMPSVVGTPAILSACLITLEPEPSIRIMPDFHDQEASPKKSLIFQTPGDLSCTHILTFPVGTEINLEVQDQTADTKADENWEFGDLDIMEGLDDGDTEIMKDLGLETPSSAAIRQSGGTSMFFSEDSSAIEIQNQPLASGYYISTAPAPELPSWFWATCPSAKRHSPVHLKSSLHININEVKNDDIAMESTKEKDKEKEKEEKDVHPLESRQTEEVLRHVLESYNALSWLNLNRQTGDRYSCLPIHIQHLLRLYHSVARLLA